MKKVLIIEDEEASAQRLQRMVLQVKPKYEMLEILGSIKKSAEWFRHNNQPDLLFMDIQLSDGASFELFNLVEITCPVIFTTAYDEHALKSFRYNTIDYLLKPVEIEELERALIKFEAANISHQAQRALMRNLKGLIGRNEYRTRFLVPYRDQFRQIHIEAISYFFSERGNTFIVSYDGEKSLITQTLDSLEEQLDPKLFFRANRQYIVHINAIVKVHTYFNSKLKLELKQGAEGVIVSRLKASQLKNWLDY